MTRIMYRWLNCFLFFSISILPIFAIEEEILGKVSPSPYFITHGGSILSVSPRKMAFSSYSPGKSIRATKIRTTETQSGYSYFLTEKQYKIESQNTEHTLWELAGYIRLIEGKDYQEDENILKRWKSMVNFYPSLLMGSGFEYFQARIAGDFALSWNPIKRLQIAPAFGTYYAYLGNTWKFSGKPSNDADLDETDELYTVYDSVRDTHYLFIFGPHNWGLYYGLYLELLVFRFLDISIQWMQSLYDTPFLSGTEKLNTIGGGISISGKSSNTLHRFCVGLVFYPKGLGVDFNFPLTVFYREVFYPSLALKESGFGVGLVIIAD